MTDSVPNEPTLTPYENVLKSYNYLCSVLEQQVATQDFQIRQLLNTQIPHTARTLLLERSSKALVDALDGKDEDQWADYSMETIMPAFDADKKGDHGPLRKVYEAELEVSLKEGEKKFWQIAIKDLDRKDRKKSV
jgi:hypothetical protein